MATKLPSVKNHCARGYNNLVPIRENFDGKYIFITQDGRAEMAE